mmetsp:Transcript_699/g.834  ORF Transcript_699/g.834 Transcript_699/m.834 type:complete len:209 (-) Transcript_699:432-1058(-)
MAVFPVLGTGKVVNGECSRSCPSDGTFDSQQVFAHCNSEVSHFTPVFTPRITNNPILFFRFIIHAPSYNTNNMIGTCRMRIIVKNTTTVSHDWFSINSCCNRTTCEYLSLNGIGIFGCSAIFSNCGIREYCNFAALTTHTSKCITGTADIICLTGCINMLTESIGGFTGACHIGLAGIIRNVTPLLNEFVGSGMVSTMTATCHFGTTI